MFLKQEKPEMDYVERKKNCSNSKGKILGNFLKNCHKIFLHILMFQSILSIFYFFEKKNFHFEKRTRPLRMPCLLRAPLVVHPSDRPHCMFSLCMLLSHYSELHWYENIA